MKKKIRANKSNAINAANALLQKYCIDDPSHIPFRQILGAEGVYYQERIIKGHLGNLIRLNGKGLITISSKITHKGRKRFVTAHELGHWLLHRDIPHFIDDKETLHDWHNPRSKYEVEANMFASQFLMPSELFKKKCSGQKFSVELLKNLSNYFQTSYTATSFRYSEIGNESIVVIYSQNSRVVWYKPSPDFPFSFYDYKFPIPSETITASYYKSNLKKNIGGTTIAKKWFSNDYTVKDDQYLYEEIFPFPSINGCLTFLWQHEVNFENF
jgi:Predicted Zn peptidase